MSKAEDIASKIKVLIDKTNRIWGIYSDDIDVSKRFALNENRVFETASTIKVFILLALFNKLQKEKISLNTLLNVRKEHIGVIGRSSGILQYFRHTHPLSIYNLALLMIVLSDNPATNVLIEYVGKNYINNYITKNLRLIKTKLLTDRVNFPRKFRVKVTKMGTTSPYEDGYT